MSLEYTEEERIENLKKFVAFMDGDVALKAEISNLKPTEMDLYHVDESSRLDYLERASSTLKEAKRFLQTTFIGYSNTKLAKLVEQRMEEIEKKFYQKGYGKEETPLKPLYQEFFLVCLLLL